MVPYRSEFACKLVAQECTGRTFLGGDVRGSNQQRCFCTAKTRVRKCTRMYTSGQSIFKKANGERLFRTDTDVREIEQQRVCSANSTLNSVHGSTLFNSATDVGGSIQKRVCLQTRSPKMYRTYILGRGCPGFYTVSSFSFMKNSKFRNVQGRTFLNDGIPAATANPQRIRTDTNVREIKQQRVCPANSTLNSVHGRTLFNSATDGGGSTQQRCFCDAKTRRQNAQGRAGY